MPCFSCSPSQRKWENNSEPQRSEFSAGLLPVCALFMCTLCTQCLACFCFKIDLRCVQSRTHAIIVCMIHWISYSYWKLIRSLSVFFTIPTFKCKENPPKKQRNRERNALYLCSNPIPRNLISLYRLIISFHTFEGRIIPDDMIKYKFHSELNL